LAIKKSGLAHEILLAHVRTNRMPMTNLGSPFACKRKRLYKRTHSGGLV